MFRVFCEFPWTINYRSQRKPFIFYLISSILFIFEHVVENGTLFEAEVFLAGGRSRVVSAGSDVVGPCGRGSYLGDSLCHQLWHICRRADGGADDTPGTGVPEDRGADSSWLFTRVDRPLQSTRQHLVSLHWKETALSAARCL